MARNRRCPNNNNNVGAWRLNPVRARTFRIELNRCVEALAVAATRSQDGAGNHYIAYSLARHAYADTLAHFDVAVRGLMDLNELVMTEVVALDVAPAPFKPGPLPPMQGE
jgi:hypothetical protein